MIESITERFSAALSKKQGHNELIVLADDGWEERMPDPDSGWSFTHPDFPGSVVWWSPTAGIWRVDA